MSETNAAPAGPSETADDLDTLDEELEREKQAELDDRGEPESPEPSEAETGEQPQPDEAVKLREQIENLNKALREERHKGREHRDFRREVEDKLKSFEDRFGKKDAPESKEEWPDPSEKPLDALMLALNKIKTYEQTEEERKAEKERQDQERERQTALRQYGAQAEADFRIEQPDYDEAAKHYATHRIEEIQTVYNLSVEEAKSYLQQELNSALMNSVQRRYNPAAAIYEAAKRRGYAPNSAEAENQAQTEDKVQAPQAQPSKALQQIQQGRAMSPSLPQGGKVKGKVDPLKMIDELPPTHKDFDKYWQMAFEKGLL